MVTGPLTQVVTALACNSQEEEFRALKLHYVLSSQWLATDSSRAELKVLSTVTEAHSMEGFPTYLAAAVAQGAVLMNQHGCAPKAASG